MLMRFVDYHTDKHMLEEEFVCLRTIVDLIGIPNSNNVVSLCSTKIISFRRETKTFVGLLLLLLVVNFIAGYKNQTYKGDVTFYYEWRGNYGSCALQRAKKDPFYVAAMSRFFMKLPLNITNPNNHPYCMAQHCVKISGKRGSVVLKVSDTCVGCKPHDVDVADRVFPLLDDPNKGRVVMSWKWVDCRKHPPGKLKNKN